MNNGHTESHPRYRHPALAAITGGETTLRRSLRVLRKRQWVFLIIAGGFITLATLFAMSRPMTYRSEASVEVGPGMPMSAVEIIGDRATSSHAPPWEHHFKTQEALLRREGLVKQVLESFPPGHAAIAEYMDSTNPVRRLARHIDVDAIPSTFVIKVALEHANSEHGPEIVNRLIQFYIEDSNRRLHDQILGVLKDLEDKTLPEFHNKVVDAEKKYQEFMAKNGAGDIRERHSGLLDHRRRLADRIFDLRMSHYELLADPRRGDLLDDDPAAILGSPRLIETLLADRSRLEADIARASATLQEKHPRLIELRSVLEAVNQRLREALKVAVESRERLARTSEERLDKHLKTTQEALRKLLDEEKDVDGAIAMAATQLAEHHRLESEVTAAREIYNTYLKRQADVKAMAGAGVASVSVVDLASTPVGTKKDTQIILALGVVLGLLFGACGVVIAEQNDDRASTPYEAEAATGMDVLVSIPKLPKPMGSRAPVVPKDNPLKSPLEPFRRLRYEVAARLHGVVEGARVVAVLSAGSGEGKSTVAINLARVLGLEKRKVLLVDAEFRRPKLKALLGDAKAPGLEEYLRTETSFRECAQATSLAGVDLIGASKPMDEAPEMPSMERFQDLWRKARSFYDYIVVDAGPVNHFSEAAGVATSCDGAILVMDERHTKLRDVVSARRVLENLDVKILGLIVNRSANPWAGGLVSRILYEAHRNGNGNGHVEAPAPAPVMAAAPQYAPVFVAETTQGEDPTLKAVLDRLFQEMDTTKERAVNLEHEKTTLSAREEQLRKAMEQIEREHAQRLDGELRKNAELAQKFTEFVESSRSKEEEQLKKLEVIFTKSLEGVNKKLTDLRLRSFAGGGGGGGGGMEGDVQLRPSQATIDGIFSQKIESNLGAMDKPAAKKATGGVNSALDRLKNMRGNPPPTPPKKDEEKK